MFSQILKDDDADTNLYHGTKDSTINPRVSVEVYNILIFMDMYNISSKIAIIGLCNKCLRYSTMIVEVI